MLVLLSESTKSSISMSWPNVGLFGTLILKESMPASVFDAVSVVMSGAPAFSPVESW